MIARQLALVLGLVVLALGAGWWGRSLFAENSVATGSPGRNTSGGPCPDGSEPLYWKAPMDPTYVREAPGKSPMGMDLVPECRSGTVEGSGGSVVVDSGTMQSIGVRTTPVERRDLSRAVRAVGRVAYDERRVSHVHTKVQGWVETLHIAFVGQEVKRGQALLEIYSPELVATQEELLLAARYRDSTAGSPFEDVRGGGASLFEATKRRLALWDVPERDIKRLLETGKARRTLTLYAPASGVVTRLGVRTGMEVKPNASLYTIADLSRVWVLADVYEYELPWLALGQKATVELSYLPGEEMEGELTYIAPFLDPKTRTAEVRLELDNSAGRLKPEMFGNALIAGAPHPNALAIPTSAVIRSGTRTLAIVALGEGRFEPRDIGLGLDSGDGWLEVISGLEEHDEVVVSSQFLIDSESNLQEAVRKLLSAGRGTSSEPEIDHSAHETPDAGHPAEHDSVHSVGAIGHGDGVQESPKGSAAGQGHAVHSKHTMEHGASGDETPKHSPKGDEHSARDDHDMSGEHSGHPKPKEGE